MMITADHGNDPTTPSTDHSREYVPLLVTGPRVTSGADLGTRRTFADLGQTVADNFGVGMMKSGTSFLRELTGQ
jgi:phosphopentomutase